jgi:hypothetical protein
MTAIRINIDSYQRKHGLPIGRAFWTFKVVSPSMTSKDYIFTTDKPMPFEAACKLAREIAGLRRSELIVLLPGD